MAIALRNKQILALIVVALISLAIITFFVLGMILHLNMFNFFFHQGVYMSGGH